jgi:dihydroorotate dehydrogenase
MYASLIRPLLFRMDAEKAHHFATSVLKQTMQWSLSQAIAQKLFANSNPNLRRNVFGLDFPNPIGLAAGFDKNAEWIDELAAFGFGFIEIGTVTPMPQMGNPLPRLFRLPPDRGLINRMGFNNEGLDYVVSNLQKRKNKILIGGNIGKNKVTPNETAWKDYEKAFEALFPLVDYFTVNISSPNTPNLRELQEKEPLRQLLGQLQEQNQKKNKPKPLLLKIAPDLTDSQLLDIVEIVKDSRFAGIIATNTTISRENLLTDKNRLEQIGNGGLSGLPLKNRSTEVIRFLKQHSEGKYQLIGVGGIFTAQDALEKLEAGADLLQIYTGFIYEGPSIVKKINRVLAQKAGF